MQYKYSTTVLLIQCQLIWLYKRNTNYIFENDTN